MKPPPASEPEVGHFNRRKCDINSAAYNFYRGMIERGMDPELARVTLTRKFAAITLRLWKTGEAYDPKRLTAQAT